MSQWSWASASTLGTSHARTGAKKQDAVRCFQFAPPTGPLVVAIADGAGSASMGGPAAALVCRRFTSFCADSLTANRKLPSEDAIWAWLDDTRDVIRRAALVRGVAFREFSTTLIGVIAREHDGLIIHIGDGAVVATLADSPAWTALSWPKHGEYASTTYFVTDEPAPNLQFSLIDAPIRRFAAFTDGLERLALDFASRTPFRPFCDGMIAPLINRGVPGCDTELSHQLKEYLCSEKVNSRTDDDKTIVLASQ
ncbi:MAG: protein phosphatase 2C domain-containing protein [Gammaproteobacteria bacterium]|nr:protein phosphatase 2C domain-containing protein [Gammaproteobacteria bacterium]MBI5615116.1 protein phosphatase 2C domain-containing protein [Gammaproteobacteria bacterium]